MLARVHKTVKRLTRNRRSMVTVTLADGSGFLDLAFFNQPWAAGIYKAGHRGRGLRHRDPLPGRLQLANLEAEILGGDERDLVHTGRITPVHRATEGSRRGRSASSSSRRSRGSRRSPIRCRPTC